MGMAQAAPTKGATIRQRLANLLDERTEPPAVVRRWRARVFPDHWSFRLAQVAVASFVVCAVTGVLLSFGYEPSVAPVTYDGPYEPLQGTEMSRALDSTLALSFEVPGGLLARQVHSWSASLMVAAVMLHVLRIFFSGGFRRPRRLAWLGWFGVLFAAMTAGLTGHVLTDDMLSGNTLAVTDGLLKSVPVIGAWLAQLVFGGHSPTGAIATFHPLHVYVLPAAIVGLLAALAVLGARHGPAQYPGPGRTEGNVVGRPLRVAVVKAAGLFLVVLAVLVAMGATMSVNPVWSYGPADPGNAARESGALWYLAFLDGAQVLVPPGWELVLFDRTWVVALLAPLGVVGLFFAVAMAYPFLEGWLTRDRREHHLLTRPRNAPTRTGVGVAGVVFYGVLWAAAGSATIARAFSLGVEDVVRALQLALVIGPVVAFFVTRLVCLGLAERDLEVVRKGRETGRVVRLPDGGYVTVRTPVDAHERFRLVGDLPEAPDRLATGDRGMVG